MTQLSAEVKTLGEVCESSRSAMYKVYSEHYDATGRIQFNKDLDSKTHIVLMRDQSGVVQGFSSLARYWRNYLGRKIQVVYSGDTVIHREYWGEQVLPERWIKLTGQFKREAPDAPLYWFLIVKGHRTYRYLSIFSKEYYPSYKQPTPIETQKLIDELAIERFTEFYKPATGLIQFPQSRGHLKASIRGVPDNALRRAEVQYFMKRNPGYVNGDELVCLTELSVENLSRRAQKHFVKGLNG